MQAIADVVKEFRSLLEKAEGEQVYQAFLERHTQLIPREFIQNHGVHFSLVLRKLAMARDYTTDFFYLSKSSMDWHAVLVELEKPHSHYFSDPSKEFHRDFVTALQQISRWRAWFSESENHASFVNGTLGLVRLPIGMQRHPCHIKYVLVLGRRREFENNPIRRQLIHAQERDDFKILSYDSLTEDVGARDELYVGIRKNEYIDIISDKFLSESIFASMSPETLRISRALKEQALSKKGTWFHVGIDEDGKEFPQMERALRNIRLRDSIAGSASS